MTSWIEDVREVGARAGRVLDHRVFPAMLGALFVGGIGGLMSLVKYVIH